MIRFAAILRVALAIAPFVLLGCNRKPQTAAPDQALLRSESLRKRLEDPIPPLPGAAFMKDHLTAPVSNPMRFHFFGSHQRSGSYAKDQTGTSLILDVSGLDIPALYKEALTIAPGHLNITMKPSFDRLKRWDDVGVALKENRGALVSEFMTACALHFADFFSGLGLQIRRFAESYDPAIATCSYLLSDPEGANLVLLTLSFGIPQARVTATISCLTHDSGPPEGMKFPDASTWGTR